MTLDTESLIAEGYASGEPLAGDLALALNEARIDINNRDERIRQLEAQIARLTARAAAAELALMNQTSRLASHGCYEGDDDVSQDECDTAPFVRAVPVQSHEVTGRGLAVAS